MTFSHGLLIAGVSLSPRPLSKRELTIEFYQQREHMELRHGPLRTNEERFTGLISYDSQPFVAPVMLTTPPLISVVQGTAQVQPHYPTPPSFTQPHPNPTVLILSRPALLRLVMSC